MEKRKHSEKRGLIKRKRRPSSFNFIAKKNCRFCKEKEFQGAIDYKNVDILSRHTTEQGKILPSRISGTCAFHQRQLARAIKRARAISLMAYTRE